ncbi:MAG: GTP-binding protein [Candidatus Lokiarchaeota archaeon]|nr:GTP-binding protein [Candidatus Lokiarchaeota archaeon]MBD3199759.1 GTP-binding protein [Candidatus Lokiarchaeota archaeon]
MSGKRKLLFKCVIVGDGGVGKSTLVKRLMTGKYIEQKITIGTDLATYKINYKNHSIVLQLWDFAGEKRFRFFLPNYARGAMGCLLCYDIARRNTFKNLDEWYKIVTNNSDPVIALVGCKRDLADKKRSVTEKDAKELQDEKNIDIFYETSSKTGDNVKALFEELTKKIVEINEIPL